MLLINSTRNLITKKPCLQIVCRWLCALESTHSEQLNQFRIDEHFRAPKSVKLFSCTVNIVQMYQMCKNSVIMNWV